MYWGLLYHFFIGSKDIIKILSHKNIAYQQILTEIVNDITYGTTSLIAASQEGHKNIVELLLEHKSDPNITTNEGLSSIFISSNSGNKSIVQLLLAHKADPNIPWKDGITAIWVTSQNGYKDILQLLLDYNANPNAITSDGMTPIVASTCHNHGDIVEILLYKVNVHKKIFDDYSSVDMIKHHCPSNLYILQEAMGKINQLNHDEL